MARSRSFFFFSSRRRHTRFKCDWSSDVCSSDLNSTIWASSRGLPPEDAQIVEFTQQLIRQHRADAASVKALQKRFGDDGFIQLTGAIGYYSMLAMTVNACELEAGAGQEVLKV